MKKLLIYLKDYKIESVLAPLFKMLEALFELFVPIVMARVIDVGIPAGDRSYVIRMCLVMILLGIIGLVCSITAQYFSAKAACGFAAKLRHSLFEHIQSLSFTEMDTIGTSTLITRMTSDINQVQNGVNMFLRLFMRSPFIVVGAMVAAFIIDVRSAIIFAVAIPLLSVIVFIIMYVSIPLYKKALINYMSQILVELIKLANLIVLINKAIACGNRVQSVFEISSSMSESPDQSIDTETDNAVEFKDVSLRYGSSETDSLSEITFSAKKGETIGIIGGTGSGKSSIVNMIPRFYDAFSGEVLVDGKNVKDYSIKALRGKIGVVPQKAVLFNGTIRENLLWGNENASDEDIYEALKISQAIDVVEGRRKGLDSEVAQGGKNFSGGQRQRLTIARALVRKPEILILDDSASALDFATDAALRKAIREMENSPTVFIVSQRASSIQYADKIIVLDDGRIAGIGSHDSLLESCGVYQEIYYSQFPKNRKED